MQYISFYKDRLPFKPKSNVVIYFDVTGIGAKRYYHVLNEYYDRIVEEFRRGGLEFCFLPKIAHEMDLETIYHYFNPQASELEALPYRNFYDDHDLLEFIVADFNARHLSPGLIQYMGENFDKESTYTFSYTPIPVCFDDSPISQIQLYVKLHGVNEDVFSSSRKPHLQFTESISEEDDDVDLMMSEVQLMEERLRQSGVGEIALQRLFKPTQQLSRLHIRYGHIFLPDYNNMEIKMPPLSKAIYMLYLRHPEGIFAC